MRLLLGRVLVGKLLDHVHLLPRRAREQAGRDNRERLVEKSLVRPVVVRLRRLLNLREQRVPLRRVGVKRLLVVVKERVHVLECVVMGAAFAFGFLGSHHGAADSVFTLLLLVGEKVPVDGLARSDSGGLNAARVRRRGAKWRLRGRAI